MPAVNRRWPYYPRSTQHTDAMAAQYRERPSSDPVQPTAILRPEDKAECPKCGRTMTRREYWKHKC